MTDQAGPPSGTEAAGWDWAYSPPGAFDPFQFDYLLINQRAFSLADRYDVLDEQGVPRFLVHRLLRAGGMIWAGMVRTAVVLFGFYMGFRLIVAHELLAALIVFWALGHVANLVFLLVAPFRHIFVYLAGWGESYPLMTITQDTKISLVRRFTVYDDWGQAVAQFQKPRWTDLYRRRWRAYTPQGELICEVREDTWARSIARRVVGPFFGLLRTDFYFFDAAGNPLGTYRRRWTILDRYVLDLGMDPWRRLDRRVALAAGILLDTGERR